MGCTPPPSSTSWPGNRPPRRWVNDRRAITTPTLPSIRQAICHGEQSPAGRSPASRTGAGAGLPGRRGPGVGRVGERSGGVARRRRSGPVPRWTGPGFTMCRSHWSPAPTERRRWCGCWRRCCARPASAPGYSSTDGVIVDTTLIGEGDFSGPSGARLALRDPRVQAAVLETARGGLLRRGLAVEGAQAAVVTNVAEDHLGEFGVNSLAELAETKLLVAKGLRQDGTLVLNADDPMLVAAGSYLGANDLLVLARPYIPGCDRSRGGRRHRRAGGPERNRGVADPAPRDRSLSWRRFRSRWPGRRSTTSPTYSRPSVSAWRSGCRVEVIGDRAPEVRPATRTTIRAGPISWSWAGSGC